MRRIAEFLSSPAGPIFAAPVVDIVEDDEPRMRLLPQTVTYLVGWVVVFRSGFVPGSHAGGPKPTPTRTSLYGKRTASDSCWQAYDREYFLLYPVAEGQSP